MIHCSLKEIQNTIINSISNLIKNSTLNLWINIPRFHDRLLQLNVRSHTTSMILTLPFLLSLESSEVDRYNFLVPFLVLTYTCAITIHLLSSYKLPISSTTIHIAIVPILNATITIIPHIISTNNVHFIYTSFLSSLTTCLGLLVYLTYFLFLFLLIPFQLISLYISFLTSFFPPSLISRTLHLNTILSIS